MTTTTTARQRPGSTRWPLVALVAHLGALGFGLAGILYIIPNLAQFASNRNAMRVYTNSMEHAGSVHIILGAVAMLLFGVVAIGWGKTLIFFAISVPLSLTSELLGTGTGWPFGNYAYTDFLGYKVLDHVPFSIPLSWFYMGFASFLLSSIIVAQLGLRARGLWSVLGGVWLLTVWDLVLDPAMAHESLSVKFWTWSESGPYFGMPIKNFVGWAGTALLFMALSRWLWREDVGPRQVRPLFPFAIYAVNTIFAIALSISVDLWAPVVLALVLGVAPASFALRADRSVVSSEAMSNPSGAWRARTSLGR